MKQVYLNILKFSSVVLIVYLIIIFLLSVIKYKIYPLITYTSNYYPSKGGHTFQSMKEFSNEREKWDVIFLGSSHVYRGFDPRIFSEHNIVTFNLGTSGQSIESSFIVYEKLIAEKGVKTIVLELFASQMVSTDKVDESTFDIAYNSPGYNISLACLIDQADWRLVNLGVYKLFTTYANSIYCDSTYVGRGFSERSDSANTLNFEYDQLLQPSMKKYKALEKLIVAIKQHQQQVIIVSHPMPREYPILVHQQFTSFIRPLLNKYNVAYFDYTQTPSIASHDFFYDSNHLNQSGVCLFNSLLLSNNEFKKLLNVERP